MTARKAERIRHAEVREPGPGLWSNCRKVGDQVFISGLVALDGDRVVGEGDAYAQASFIFGAIKNLMEAAGGHIGDLAKMTIFVTDMAHRPGVLRARREYFQGDFPCSTLVAVSALIDPRLLVEIEGIGVVESGNG